MSKATKFIRDYLTHNGVITGTSGFIERYKLPEYAAYTSGDSILRNDSNPLGLTYKFCRFCQNLKKETLYEKTSISWDLTEEDKDMLIEEHSKLEFPKKGTTIYYIKFYGKGNARTPAAICPKISKAICKLPCVSCGTSTGIQCDHKNDLVLVQNDKRLLNIATQKMTDFQPLCKHCNIRKREVKKKMMKERKRQPAPGYPADLSFWKGDENLDWNDTNWYEGTYWGDVKAYKEKLRFV